MSQRVDARTTVAEILGTWQRLREGLELFVRVEQSGSASDAIRLACASVAVACRDLQRIKAMAEAVSPLQLQTFDEAILNDIEKRTLSLASVITKRDWTLGPEDSAEAHFILRLLPEPPKAYDRPIDRPDCSYSATGSSVTWFGRVFPLNEAQCIIIELAWEAWEQGGGWFSQRKAQAKVGSSAYRYRLRDSWPRKQREHFHFLFEGESAGSWRLRSHD